MKNSWICQKEKTVISSPVMTIIEKDCQSSEDDRRHKFYLMKSNDWCNIIPITEDHKVVMVKQFRIGIDQHTLEVPGGVIDSTDSDTQSAAIREMEEETGYAALPDAKCTYLGWTHPNPAILDNRCHSYIIGPVKKRSQQNLDHGEMIEIVEIPIKEIPERIMRGEITHALMLNTFFFLALNESNVSKELQSQLNSFCALG